MTYKPLNQNLNTTDDVTFAKVTTNSIHGLVKLTTTGGSNWLYFDAAGGFYNNEPTISSRANIFRIQALSNGASGKLYLSGDVGAFLQYGGSTKLATLATGISVDGNLNVESGGTQRVYNLGSDGDTDTEFLETRTVSNIFVINPDSTGAGANRDFFLQSALKGSYCNIRLASTGLLYLRYGNTANITVGNGYNIIAATTRPAITGTTELGNSTYRWSDVYSVNGSFSGVVTSDSNLSLQSNNASANIILANSGAITISANNAIYQQFTTTGIYSRRDVAPTFNGSLNLGLDTNRWANTYSVDGSFTGNLVTEVGGKIRNYLTGTEGDVDTEYLETSFDANGQGIIGTRSTGAGLSRNLLLQSNGGNGANITLTSNIQAGYIGTNVIYYFQQGTFSIYADIRPDVTNTRNLGVSSARYANVYSVAGDFSGNIKCAGLTPNANGTGTIGSAASRFNTVNTYNISMLGTLTQEVGSVFKMYSTGAAGDADTSYLQFNPIAGDFYLGTKKTGVATVADLYIQHDGGTKASVNSTGLRLHNLPATDPAIAGQLWNHAGTLKVSAGGGGGGGGAGGP